MTDVTDTPAWEAYLLSRLGEPVEGHPGFHHLRAPQGSRARWICGTCGRHGIAGCRWMDTCLRGHAPCADCGRQLTLRLDGTPRIHTRCTGREVGPQDAAATLLARWAAAGCRHERAVPLPSHGRTWTCCLSCGRVRPAE